ncbi:hypothetical protein ABZ499_31335 [Streptomyces sp. NPDC019990]|uniref:hypothetical protein n=1 Tax=Streptomyces sp. NPDC019990 TaxID=3154693 RepID=UPI0033EF9F4B
MQRPSSPPTTVAVVGVSTLTGEAALAAGDGGAPGFALPIACLTAAAAGVVRRYIARERARGLAELAARERELDRRESDLARREEAFRRTRWTTDLRMASGYARIDRLRGELAAERQAHAELQIEYRELTREFNQLCLDAASADAQPAEAHRPPLAVGQTTSAAATSGGPRRHSERHDPRPFLTVVKGFQHPHGSG